MQSRPAGTGRVHLLDALAASRRTRHQRPQADVTDEDAVRRAIGAGVKCFGRIDVLFSNGGISGAVAPIAEYPRRGCAASRACRPTSRAKHAQVGLMRTAAKELAPRRIRVNTLHPGPTSTPFQDDIEMRGPAGPGRRRRRSSTR
jgi:NAD(P)-dependent dehydrogenase (short-subunit alcohol dehydrogenase family)